MAGLSDGRFKRLNPPWERTLGFTARELKARPFIDFVHPDDRASSLAQVAGLANGVPIVSFENRFRCKDGSYRWLAWTATPSLETGLLYAAGHDVTERKRAEAEIAAHQLYLQRMVDINSALLDASVDGIRLVDLEGRSLLANSVIEHLRSDVFKLPRFHDAAGGRRDPRPSADGSRCLPRHHARDPQRPRVRDHGRVRARRGAPRVPAAHRAGARLGRRADRTHRRHARDHGRARCRAAQVRSGRHRLARAAHAADRRARLRGAPAGDAISTTTRAGATPRRSRARRNG